PYIEDIIFHHAFNAEKSDFEVKYMIINGIKQFYEHPDDLKRKDELKKIFKKYLKEIKEDQTEFQADQRERTLIEWNKIDINSEIIILAAKFDLGFEKETFEFIKNIKHRGSHVIREIADKYQKNKEFINLILEKLKNTNDSSLASNIFRALIKIKYPNWKDLLRKHILTKKVIDAILLRELEENNIIDEEILLTCFTDGHFDQVQYVSRYLGKNPKKLDEWTKIRDEFLKILMIPNWYNVIFQKKKTVLETIEKLKRKDMIKQVMFNLKYAENKFLKTYAAKAIGEIGRKELLPELEMILEKEKDITQYSMFGENEILNAINKIKNRE
ncbi:MAG: hypothetical protein ACTSRG_22415, partial [Candidatus Helarchaeota archaeon]